MLYPFHSNGTHGWFALCDPNAIALVESKMQLYFFGTCLGSSSSLCSSCSSNESGCRTAPGFLFRCHVNTLASCMNFLRDRLPMCFNRSVNTKSSTLRPFSCCSFSKACMNSWFHRSSFINSSFCSIMANCSSEISYSGRTYRQQRM